MGSCVSYNEDITTSFIDYTMKFDRRVGITYDDEEGKYNSIRFISKESMIKSMKNKMRFYVNNNISHKIYEIMGDKLIIVFTVKNYLKDKSILKCVEHKRCISFYKFNSTKSPTNCSICNKKKTRTNQLYYMNICSKDTHSKHGFHLECIQHYIETNPKCENRVLCPCCNGSLNIEALESFYEQFVNPISFTISTNQNKNQNKIVNRLFI